VLAGADDPGRSVSRHREVDHARRITSPWITRRTRQVLVEGAIRPQGAQPPARTRGDADVGQSGG